jgi:hypothetical protein
MFVAGKVRAFMSLAAYAAMISAACGYGLDARADGTAATTLDDSVLDNISGTGISVTGSLNSSCSTAASDSICVGTFGWTDSHSNDASTNKGAVVMNGYVQQNLNSDINLNATQSATAQGVNINGSVSFTQPGQTLNMVTNNNATGFIGGF